MSLFKNKIVQILLIAALTIILFQAGQFAVLKYQYFKSLETEITELKKELSKMDQKEVTILNTGKTNTKKASTDKKSIHDKLKADEKVIDNTPISNNELEEFLSRHGESNN